MIYIALALVAAFSGGLYLGWSAAMVAFVQSVKRGRAIIDVDGAWLEIPLTDITRR